MAVASAGTNPRGNYGRNGWVYGAEESRPLLATRASDCPPSARRAAKDLVVAEKADDEGRLDDITVVDPDRGALTQILAEYAPDGTPVIVENVAEQIDALVRPVRDTGWQTSQPGDREVRRQLRLVLKNNGLPPQGAVFDRAYAYIVEHY